MTLVRFYILNDGTPGSRERFACRLAERGMREGMRTFINVNERPDCRRIDELLWTYNDQSFVPHAILGDDPDHDCAVGIGCGQEPGQDYQVLINLADDVPHFFSRFEKTLEIIDGQDAVKQAGRERYRFYQDRGYPLKSHPV